MILEEFTQIFIGTFEEFEKERQQVERRYEVLVAEKDQSFAEWIADILVECDRMRLEDFFEFLWKCFQLIRVAVGNLKE